MINIDIIYDQPNLVEITPYQFNAFLFYWARNKDQFPDELSTCDYTSDASGIILQTAECCLLIYPSYPDQRWYHPKIDTDLWSLFKQLAPEKAAPVL